MLDYTYDICLNCRFEADCALKGNHLENVFFCEEYRVAQDVPGKGNQKKKAVARTAKTGVESSPSRVPDRVQGLCSNCIHRDKCSFEKPASGVWHCEEYA